MGLRLRISGALLAAVLLFALVAPYGRAEAEPKVVRGRIALVALPASLVDAIETSVAAWEVEVLIIEAAALSAAMPGTADGAREIAATNTSESVVWISVNRDGAAVWVYDAGSDRVTARRLASAPPYDDPTAAAIGLTVKTLLRHSLVAPRAERFGARPPNATARPRQAEPFTLSLEVGISTRAALDLPLEPRLSVAAGAALRSRLVVGARARVGLGRRVDAGELGGQLATHGLVGEVELEFLRRRRFAARGRVGGGFELSRLVVSTPSVQTVTRFNPLVEVGAGLAIRLPRRAELVAGVNLGILVRRQRYEVSEVRLLTLPRTELDVALMARFQL